MEFSDSEDRYHQSDESGKSEDEPPECGKQGRGNVGGEFGRIRSFGSAQHFEGSDHFPNGADDAVDW